MRKSALLCLATLLSGFVSAHPHSWISLTSDFVINDDAKLVQIRQRWIFDAFYSALTLDDISKTYPDRSMGLEVQASDMVKHLASVDYFSHLQVGDAVMDIPRPNKWHLSTMALGDEEVLIFEMHFDVPATKLTDETIQWSVYDPTYYVSMNHESVEYVRLVNDSVLECEPTLKQGEPTDEQIMYAASLDKTQPDSSGLGQYFAQQITVTCF
jgi:ABC-type uncharacterized transport system substrate-binding protein